MEQSNNILELKNFSAAFKSNAVGAAELFYAVNGIEMSVKSGSFTAIVGESGSGKSVTALSMTGLVRPALLSGQALYRGKDTEVQDMLLLSAAGLEALRGKEIAYVFQDPGSFLNPVMKTGEQVAEAYRAHRDADREAARGQTLSLLRSLGIRDAERVYASYPHQLSGGMKQRVILAIALISDPKLLVADEPTTALDVMTEKEIMELLLEAQKKRGLTVLFITHNLPLASAYADTVYVMEKGKVVERMEKEGGVFHPREAYSKKLFKAHFKETAPKTPFEL